MAPVSLAAALAQQNAEALMARWHGAMA